ncbi:MULTISPECIES: SDR family oxidoreductase [Amycolatopsis]|uniref:SDR family oxidoreductase n=1 Tax=Amycolatopsis TaxID=1813 RepID=UPI0004884071|nr:SDR family oxidoreductase [Amycolatopsis thermoflava]
MTYTLKDKRVLLIGSGSGIGSAVAAALRSEGAAVVLAGRNPDKFADTMKRLDITEPAVHIDLSKEDTLRALAGQVQGRGEFDHVISLASAPPNVPVADLDREEIIAAFDAKVVGPLLLAKHLSPLINEQGSLLFFSGVAAWRPSSGLTVMATTNGAVSFLVSALAVELAPVRVNAISPGIVDSGAWDGALGEGKARFFDQVRASNPARRVGATEDIAAAAVALLTNPFITGETLHVDGGGRFA